MLVGEPIVTFERSGALLKVDMVTITAITAVAISATTPGPARTAVRRDLTPVWELTSGEWAGVTRSISGARPGNAAAMTGPRSTT